MSADGKERASWSTSVGVHTMILEQAILHTPEKKPHVVAEQIHDAADDVVMIRLEGKNLFVEGGGNSLGVLDPAYVLGTRYTVKILASQGKISIYYNDLTTPKVIVNRSSTGCYFKAGAYTQSNTAKGDLATAYGEVVIFKLSVQHQ